MTTESTHSVASNDVAAQPAQVSLREQINAKWLSSLETEPSVDQTLLAALRDALAPGDVLDRETLRAIVDRALGANP